MASAKAKKRKRKKKRRKLKKKNIKNNLPVVIGSKKNDGIADILNKRDLADQFKSLGESVRSHVKNLKDSLREKREQKSKSKKSKDVQEQPKLPKVAPSQVPLPGTEPPEPRTSGTYQLTQTDIFILKTIKLLAVLLPVVLVAYLGYKFYAAKQFEGHYSVDFTKENMGNTDLRLYIDEDPDSLKFGDEKEINGVKVPEILNSPINFVWRPEEFPLGKEITVSAEFQDEGDWDISLVCDECEEDEKYDWKPFYRGKLKDYHLAAEFDGTYIYTKDELEQPADADSIEEWLEKNIEKGSSVEILDDDFDKSTLVNPDIDFHEGEYTVINKRLRGPHEFYVYLKDRFDLELVKRDLNWEDGDDEITIELLDVHGDVVYGSVMEDNDKTGIEEGGSIRKKFNLDFLAEGGVYLLSISGNSDWVLDSLKINTNKIVLYDRSFVLDPTVFFTEILSQKEIKVNVWHSSALQTILFRSDVSNEKITFFDDELGEEQSIILDPGDYEIVVKGDQVLIGSLLSFSEESWFLPFHYYIVSDSKEVNSNVVITNLLHQEYEDTIETDVQFDYEDFLRDTNIREVLFSVRNHNLERQFVDDETREDLGYSKVRNFEGFSIWSRIDSLTVSDYDNTKSIKSFINGNLPVGISIYSDLDETINQEELLTETIPGDFVSSESFVTNLDFSLRGSHSFYIYLEDMLKVEVEKMDLNMYDGEDCIVIQLWGPKGEEMCSSIIEDDGNETQDSVRGHAMTGILECSVPSKGVYILRVDDLDDSKESSTGDFILTDLKLNTNKIVVKDRFVNTEPIVAYLSNEYESEIDLFIWLTSAVQDILVNGAETQVISLTSDDIDNNVSIIVPSGSYSITQTRGYVRVTGAYFSFSRESWFDVFKYTLSSNPDTAGVILKKDLIMSNSYIGKINLSVR